MSKLDPAVRQQRIEEMNARRERRVRKRQLLLADIAAGKKCGFRQVMSLCEEPTRDGKRCERHRLLCCKCGVPAVKECAGQTMNLMCGAPICGECHCHSE